MKQRAISNFQYERLRHVLTQSIEGVLIGKVLTSPGSKLLSKSFIDFDIMQLTLEIEIKREVRKGDNDKARLKWNKLQRVQTMHYMFVSSIELTNDTYLSTLKYISNNLYDDNDKYHAYQNYKEFLKSEISTCTNDVTLVGRTFREIKRNAKG